MYMHTHGIRAAVERDFSRNAFGLHIWEMGGEGKVAVMQPAVFQTLTEEQAVRDPWLPGVYLSREAAQQVMNDLWNAGVRPENGVDFQATVEAQKAHIKDLQEINHRLLELVSHQPAPPAHNGVAHARAAAE